MSIKTTQEDMYAGAKIGCKWCLKFQRHFYEFDSDRGILTIQFTEDRSNAFTPRGSNLYEVSAIDNSGEPYFWSYHFTFLTEHDNLAAQHVTAREVDGDVSLSNTSSQISDWLKECNFHEKCPAQIEVSLPSRVIDVATLKVIHTNQAYGKFAALSYCWGRGSQVQLRSDTILSLTQRLNFNGLPQTIKDAILVTRLLKLAYLWVC
jgi:hypothetical protein